MYRNVVLLHYAARFHHAGGFALAGSAAGGTREIAKYEAPTMLHVFAICGEAPFAQADDILPGLGVVRTS
jgi:hypothetical protein